MSFSIRSSSFSQPAARRRIARSRILLDHGPPMIGPIEVIQPLQPAKLAGALPVPIPSRGGRASFASELLSSRSHVLPPGLSLDASSRLEVPQKGAAIAVAGPLTVKWHRSLLKTFAVRKS